MRKNDFKMNEDIFTSRYDKANKTMFIKDTDILQQSLMRFVSTPQTRRTPANRFNLR